MADMVRLQMILNYDFLQENELGQIVLDSGSIWGLDAMQTRECE